MDDLLKNTKECLTSVLCGCHFPKKKFTMTNYFNEIADELIQNFEGIDNVEVSIDRMSFRLNKIDVRFSTDSIILHTFTELSETITHFFPKKSETSEDFLVPMIFDERFGIVKRRKETYNKFIASSINDFIDIIRIIEKILPDGLPKFKFVGLVEYFYIPLKRYKWDILEKFNKESYIEGFKNTEKNARNRYYFDKDEDGEKCLIFDLKKQNDYIDKEAKFGGASFDLQFIPKNPSTLEEMGGIKELLKDLSSEIHRIIDDSKFLQLSLRGKNEK